MQRRQFIALLGGAATWPLAARAQQPDQMRRIGVLMGYAESDLEAQAWVTAFVQGFKELGWIVGRNVSIDYRFGAGDADRMRAYAEELVGLAPAVILAHTSPVMAALQQATRTIPIVFVDVFAPVGQRFVSNLARPGANITGFSSVEPEIGGTWLGVLKEVDFRTGSAAPFACGLRVPLLRSRRWPDVLRGRCARPISAVGGLCRSHPKGCQARRASRASADQIRAGHQHEDRQIAGSHCAIWPTERCR
jgi:hypothetical protein